MPTSLNVRSAVMTPSRGGLNSSVAAGAGAGFLPPLDLSAARAYWAEVREAVAGGNRILLVAEEDGAGRTDPVAGAGERHVPGEEPVCGDPEIPCADSRVGIEQRRESGQGAEPPCGSHEIIQRLPPSAVWRPTFKGLGNAADGLDIFGFPSVGLLPAAA